MVEADAAGQPVAGDHAGDREQQLLGVGGVRCTRNVGSRCFGHVTSRHVWHVDYPRAVNIYAFQSTLMLVVLVVLLAVKGFAFINSLTYSAEAYEAAGKLTKQAWCAITGLGFAAQLILIGSSPLGLIHLVFTIASLVYIADVRPALAEVTSRR